MAGEALRVGAVVLFAPVSLLLELGSELRAAESTNVFGDAVLGAPPAGVVMAGPGFGCVIVAMLMAVFILGSRFFAAAAEGEDCGQTEGGHENKVQLHTSAP